MSRNAKTAIGPASAMVANGHAIGLCNGSGELENAWEGTTSSEGWANRRGFTAERSNRCGFCGGTGQKYCTTCHGTHRKKCNTCHGTGQEPDAE
ncbi:hypothetical protein BP00DRAFT_449057 [Aspergillus indologenus CBS 114.80]|uniref:Uncharacterized protein n=1 Tax=Aspergillus indologenus CBS 114.80 TaxID=1450541 RepID=A0A2V5I344_9EURO|nr:hypothetical protein BP00DRAFT_449057 [Aspergillus indologenus CBS 114.80]